MLRGIGKLALAHFGPILFIYRKIKKLVTNTENGIVRVLMYHDIPPSFQQKMAEQLDFIIKRYNLITPTQFWKYLAGDIQLTGINILLTFDDGFLSHRKIAEEVLKSRGARAIFFIPVDFVMCLDRNAQEAFIRHNFFKREISKTVIEQLRPLSIADLQAFATEGHEIGAHTRRHAKLASIDEIATMEDEINAGGDILEQRVGVSINSFAYPFSQIDNINEKSMALISKRYFSCFSGIRGYNVSTESKYAIRRENVEPDYSIGYLQYLLEGGLDIFYCKQRQRLDLIARSAIKNNESNIF